MNQNGCTLRNSNSEQKSILPAQLLTEPSYKTCGWKYFHFFSVFEASLHLHMKSPSRNLYAQNLTDTQAQKDKTDWEWDMHSLLTLHISLTMAFSVSPRSSVPTGSRGRSNCSWTCNTWRKKKRSFLLMWHTSRINTAAKKNVRIKTEAVTSFMTDFMQTNIFFRTLLELESQHPWLVSGHSLSI